MNQCPRCGKENVDPVYPHTCTPLAPTLADALRDFVLHNDRFAICAWDEAAEQWVPVPLVVVERAMRGEV